MIFHRKAGLHHEPVPEIPDFGRHLPGAAVMGQFGMVHDPVKAEIVKHEDRPAAGIGKESLSFKIN